MDMKSLIAKMDKLISEGPAGVGSDKPVGNVLTPKDADLLAKQRTQGINVAKDLKSGLGKTTVKSTSSQKGDLPPNIKFEKKGVSEATKKKPDEDGDGVPDWADKKPGKDDKEDKKKVEETSAKMLDKMKGNDLMKSRRDAKAEEKKEKEDKKVDEAIAIQADGDEAMALLDMLKLAGRPAPQTVSMGGCGMTEADRDPTYANSPDEEVADISAATPSGTDMHRAKDSWRAAAGADNPMVAAMEGKLAKMFESLAKEQINEYGNTKKGQKTLTKVQKRATDRLIKAVDAGDAKAAKKNQDVANNAWDRFDNK